MERLRPVLLWIAPILAIGLIAAVLVVHREPMPEAPIQRRLRKEKDWEPPSPQAISPRPPEPVRPLPPPPVMPVDAARIYSVYQDFRTSVALGHDAHRDMLLPVLLRNRDVALHLAEAELAASNDETSQDIARRTLDALRRSP